MRRVLFVRQIHDRPELGPLLQWEVARYQSKILNYLIEHRPKHLFVESLIEDLAPNHPQRFGPSRDLARRAFVAGGADGRLTSVQRELLLEMGAAFIYAYLFDDVTLHRTTTAEEHRRIEESVSADGLGLHWELVTKGREKTAAREIENFLKTNPDEKVCLVYGAFHDFSDDFEEADLECVDFFEGERKAA